MRPSKKVALTGGMGAGKSLCSAILREMGFEVISADELSREVTRKGSPGLRAVISAFGAEFLTPDGELDRRRLAGKVFSDPAALQKLNELTHPLIREELCRRMAEREGVVFAEVPLLAESGMAGLFDAVWTVEAPERIRAARAAERDGTDEEAAMARIRRQAGEAERRAVSDLVLKNDGTPEDLRARITEALKTL